MLEAGRLPFIEHGADSVLSKALLNKRLVFTNSPDRISTARTGHHHHRHADR